MFTAKASFHSDYLGNGEHNHHTDKPFRFDAVAHCDNVEEITAHFPKYVKLIVRGNAVHFHVEFTANDANGGKNETGMKRLKKFLEIAGKLEWEAPFSNSYASFEDFKRNV